LIYLVRLLNFRFELPALTIVQLYLKRWEIKTFFWWIKRHLQLAYFYSECDKGEYHTDDPDDICVLGRLILFVNGGLFFMEALLQRQF
jgi:hypothetical protein